MKELDYELIKEEIVEKWINGGKLKEYMENRFDKWIYFNNGSYSELFINDEELDDYCDPEHLGCEELFYIVDSVIEDMGYEDIDGSSVSWLADSVSEDTLTLQPLSQMIDLEDIDFKIVNGKVPHWECDENTWKKIDDLLNIKND